MYVVKLQYKDSKEIMYANESIIAEKEEILNGSKYNLKWFSTSLNKAKNLYKHLLMRNFEKPDYDWSGNPKTMAWIALVELSNYAPHSEYQVLDYREFK